MTLPNNWTDDGPLFDASNQNDVANAVNTNTDYIAALPGSITVLFHYSEALSGTQNGTNEVFTTAHNYISGTTVVWRNGLREVLGVGYTESGTGQITFTTAPLTSDVIRIDYVAA